MRARDATEQNSQIEIFLPQHVRTVHVPWWSQFDARSLVHHLAANPDLSLRVKNTSQYLVGGYWRGRREVGLVLEVIASRNRAELVQSAVERFQALACGAVVLAASEADRDARWYLTQGWRVIDEIVVYSRRNCFIEGLPEPALPMAPFQPDMLAALLALEQAAFPFLWWSGKEDFLRYTSLPEVQAFVLMIGSRLAGYVSFTHRSRQGFLDRIAVHPDLQGQGFGCQLLSFALGQLDKGGARTAALNTQITNHRAQRLYERYGFIRTNNVEHIYGQWLGDRAEGGG